MNMQSTGLLAALRELPGGESGDHRSFRNHITGIVNMDRAMFAAEFVSAVSFGMWYIFDDIVLTTDLPWTEFDESYLQAAYEHLPAEERIEGLNVAEHWQQVQEEGGKALRDFHSQLKGKLAEFNGRDQFNGQGYDLELADDPYQRGYDLHGTDPDGNYVQIQVKTGRSEEQIERTIDSIEETDFPHALGSELYERIIPVHPDRIIGDIRPDYDLVESMEEGLDTVGDALDIAEAVPGVGALLAASRLIYSAVSTEREFKSADRTAKNKIQVVQTLKLMSRMGINTVLATAGSAGGGAAGSVIPGVGNLIGGIAGLIGGVGMGMYLNKHLQPHMLNLALNITGLTDDDLFYYKNKPRIDQVAISFQTRARELAAAPAF